MWLFSHCWYSSPLLAWLRVVLLALRVDIFTVEKLEGHGSLLMDNRKYCDWVVINLLALVLVKHYVLCVPH